MISGLERRAPRGILFGLGCLFTAAAMAAPAWTLDSLLGELATVRTAQARFTETRTLSLLDRPLASSGTLHYQAPARLEKRTERPKAERLLLDGDTVTVERGDPPRQRSFRLDDAPELRALIEGLRATLAGDRTTLERHYRVVLLGDRKQWLLSLDPIDARVRRFVRAIRIDGAGTAVTGVAVDQANGDRSVMDIAPATR